MEKINWFWNLVYYNLFRLEKLTQKFFSYPVMLFLNNERIKNAYTKRGVLDADKIVNNALNNPETGVNSVLASIHMGGLLVIFEYGIFNFIQVLLGKSLIQHVWTDKIYIIVFLILLLVPSGLINYFTIFKKERYLKYFKEFDKMSKEEKRIYGRKCFLIILSFWLFFIGSFVAVIKVL